MSVSADIVAAWIRPRAVIRRRLDEGRREDRALAFLMIGCGLVFVSVLPRLAATPLADAQGATVPAEARYGAAMLAWLVVMPLVLYGLAAASHLIARAVGGQGSFFGARLALFWSVLAVAPLWLLASALVTLVPGGAARAAEGLALAAWLWLWVAGLFEAEQGAARAPV